MDAQGITEFTDQLPLIAGFASAYAEVNAEQTQKVAPQHIMTFGHQSSWLNVRSGGANFFPISQL